MPKITEIETLIFVSKNKRHDLILNTFYFEVRLFCSILYDTHYCYAQKDTTSIRKRNSLVSNSLVSNSLVSYNINI